MSVIAKKVFNLDLIAATNLQCTLTSKSKHRPFLLQFGVKVMGWTPSMLLSVVSVYHYGQETFEKRIKIAIANKTRRKVSKVSYYVTVMYSNITW